jgi:NAD(P)-dependent dehydrogenase (short-subunit alcohol dehydrogenase family)
MNDMQDKVAIVTGAAGGLGGATARHLAARGARLLVTDLAEAAGQALAREIGGEFLRHDVADPDQWQAVIAAARRLGRIDILVNAAGIEGDLAKGGLATDLAEWRRVMAVNLDGTFLGCRGVMPLMLEAGSGAIVNIASIVSFMGTPSGLAYGASKAGVEQLSRSLALIGAQGGARVRCNSVHPGVIRSDMTDRIIATFGASAGLDAPAAEALVCSAIPFGVRGDPADVAQLIGYLASDAAVYVTGAAFKVDGGWSVTNAG